MTSRAALATVLVVLIGLACASSSDDSSSTSESTVNADSSTGGTVGSAAGSTGDSAASSSVASPVVSSLEDGTAISTGGTGGGEASSTGDSAASSSVVSPIVSIPGDGTASSTGGGAASSTGDSAATSSLVSSVVSIPGDGTGGGAASSTGDSAASSSLVSSVVSSPGGGAVVGTEDSTASADSSSRATGSGVSTVARRIWSGDNVASSSVVSPVVSTGGGTGGWKSAPNTQYHIQTDEGPERYFKYQTISGQYRKEKRLQDGTVVGTYGWVDPNGYLRLRDYVADNNGYRIIKTKMVFVGKDEAIGNAVSKAKNVPSQGGVGVGSLATTSSPATSIYSSTTAPVSSYPYSVPSNPLLYPSLANSPSNSLSGAYTQQQQYNINPYYTPQQQQQPYNSNPYYTPQQQQQYNTNPFFKSQQQQQQYNSNPYYTPASDRSDNYNNYRQPQAPFPLYDGVSATHNGFRYYLPRQYHEEEKLPGDQTAGSFGYIDPFGIRRVIYYNTAPGTGFVHKKNNRYVGFGATPYDPRF